MGGLSVGSMLCNAGFDVTLLEKSGDIGGRAGVSEIDGFLLDHGIHASLASDRSTANDVLKSIGHGFEAKMAGIVFYEKGRFRGLIGRNSIIRPREGFKLLGSLLKGLMRDAYSLYPVSVQEWLDKERCQPRNSKALRGAKHCSYGIHFP